jgi:hypothetical protein
MKVSDNGSEPNILDSHESMHIVVQDTDVEMKAKNVYKRKENRLA